ncbi:hypothetical protein JKY72_06490 [Candidatus Gracilibacteria bacterium]|nr:hypothetical protein [Candidatus Gracilibacteria bacterium]
MKNSPDLERAIVAMRGIAAATDELVRGLEGMIGDVQEIRAMVADSNSRLNDSALPPHRGTRRVSTDEY